MIFPKYPNRILFLLLFILSLCCPANAATEPPCELYPIAIPLKSLDGIQTGESITLINGSKPEQFGWLNWSGYKGKGYKELAVSFEPPGDSHTYRNLRNYRDRTVSVGDWVASVYKIKDVHYLSQALDELRDKPIVLPIWDDKNSKAYNAYRVAGFATFLITDFSLPGSNSRYFRRSKHKQSLTLTFLSYTQCDGSVNGNQAPVADDQTVNVDENTPLELLLTGSDPDGDSLAYTLTSAPANGTLTGTAPNFIYNPNLNYIGSDNFTFNVSDGDLESEIATVNLEINLVNEAPIAEDLETSTDEDTPVELTLAASDYDDDELIYIIESLPANGVLEVDDVRVTDVPFTLSRDRVTFIPAPDSQ